MASKGKAGTVASRTGDGEQVAIRRVDYHNHDNTQAANAQDLAREVA